MHHINLNRILRNFIFLILLIALALSQASEKPQENKEKIHQEDIDYKKCVNGQYPENIEIEFKDIKTGEDFDIPYNISLDFKSKDLEVDYWNCIEQKKIPNGCFIGEFSDLIVDYFDTFHEVIEFSCDSNSSKIVLINTSKIDFNYTTLGKDVKKIFKHKKEQFRWMRINQTLPLPPIGIVDEKTLRTE